jgi:hypothetical protein
MAGDETPSDPFRPYHSEVRGMNGKGMKKKQNQSIPILFLHLASLRLGVFALNSDRGFKRTDTNIGQPKKLSITHGV